ncbi:MAG TPA: recombinase family protein [Gemmatirosa sp.]|nr:recombinase family protein [Gemmatirosa sp.]
MRALQQDALQKAGCERTFTDVASGATAERDGLSAAFDYVRSGDTLVVWRLDRLGRSLKQLIERITTLEERGIGFRSLTESTDTTTSGGRLILHVFGALAEFERAVIRERTLAGLAAARASGRCGGRPKLMNATQIAMAKAMLADRSTPVRRVYEALHVSRATLYRHLHADRVASGERPAARPRSRALPRWSQAETLA